MELLAGKAQSHDNAKGYTPPQLLEAVSELQHSGDIWPLASFPPTECLIGPAFCLTRAALDGVGAARGTSVLFGMGNGDRGLAEPSVPLLIPSARDRGPRHSWQMEGRQ